MFSPRVRQCVPGGHLRPTPRISLATLPRNSLPRSLCRSRAVAKRLSSDGRSHTHTATAAVFSFSPAFSPRSMSSTPYSFALHSTLSDQCTSEPLLRACSSSKILHSLLNLGWAAHLVGQLASMFYRRTRCQTNFSNQHRRQNIQSLQERKVYRTMCLTASISSRTQSLFGAVDQIPNSIYYRSSVDHQLPLSRRQSSWW